jgi:hypothetical protein
MLMGLIPPSRLHLANWIKKEDPTICCLQETHLINRNKHWLRVKGLKMIYQTNGPPKTGRDSNTYLTQNRPQTYIDQKRQRTLHTNKREMHKKEISIINYMHPTSMHPISSNIR